MQQAKPLLLLLERASLLQQVLQHHIPLASTLAVQQYMDIQAMVRL